LATSNHFRYSGQLIRTRERQNSHRHEHINSALTRVAPCQSAAYSPSCPQGLLAREKHHSHLKRVIVRHARSLSTLIPVLGHNLAAMIIPAVSWTAKRIRNESDERRIVGTQNAETRMIRVPRYCPAARRALKGLQKDFPAGHGVPWPCTCICFITTHSVSYIQRGVCLLTMLRRYRYRQPSGCRYGHEHTSHQTRSVES
jgi:hypothetical protein